MLLQDTERGEIIGLAFVVSTRDANELNGGTIMNELTVNAFWDEEAGVWVASSNDVPGLVAEAETMEKLVAVLQDRIPELLEANGKQVDEEIPFHVHSHIAAVAHRHPA